MCLHLCAAILQDAYCFDPAIRAGGLRAGALQAFCAKNIDEMFCEEPLLFADEHRSTNGQDRPMVDYRRKSIECRGALPSVFCPIHPPAALIPSPFLFSPLALLSCCWRRTSEVEVGVPDAAGRAEILRVLLRGVPHAMSGDTAATANTPSDGGKKRSPTDPKGGIADLAARTHGFVGADLQLLVKEAALQALRRTRGAAGGVGGGGRGGSGGGDWEEGEEDRLHRFSGSSHAEARIGGDEGKAGAAGGGLSTLTPADFRAALPLVSPSGLREVAVEVPSVKWADIGGMEGVKQSLREVRKRVRPTRKGTCAAERDDIADFISPRVQQESPRSGHVESQQTKARSMYFTATTAAR